MVLYPGFPFKMVKFKSVFTSENDDTTLANHRALLLHHGKEDERQLISHQAAVHLGDHRTGSGSGFEMPLSGRRRGGLTRNLALSLSDYHSLGIPDLSLKSELVPGLPDLFAKAIAAKSSAPSEGC